MKVSRLDFSFNPLMLLTCVMLIICCWMSVSEAQEVVKPPASTPQPVRRPVPPPPPVPGAVMPGKAQLALPAVEKIGPGQYRLGEIQINKNSKSIYLPAVVNMNKGLLEYLLVKSGGKTHESLFRTTIDPVQLQIALLLIGLEGTDHPLSRQGAPEIPKGNPVEIYINYLKNGRMTPIKPESWIARKSDDKMVNCTALEWMFTGSVIRNGRFLAQAEGSIIAIYHDPVALIDNASPGGESDKVWFVKEGDVPSVGTPVTLEIRVKP
jgi:hypothetical protein